MNPIVREHKSDARSAVLMPKKAFFTTGTGKHREMLESFEMALRDAGIEKFNLVTVSSILPPGCEVVEKEEGLQALMPGEIVFTVMSRNSSNEPSRRIAAAIGCAIPKRPLEDFGYISEHHSYGESDECAGRYAGELAGEMYYTWKKERPLKTDFAARSAEVDEEGNWTTVIAAAVFII
ncbi:MAG: Pyruvoyl-dependent arginine decarboxylase [Methanocella sp. PtaU1.Bin125]|nr:MAG: Pyruvoyl-dependent arginine decarboxylase [Methanocella sp. PtaU1.Bin125]